MHKRDVNASTSPSPNRYVIFFHLILPPFRVFASMRLPSSSSSSLEEREKPRARFGASRSNDGGKPWNGASTRMSKRSIFVQQRGSKFWIERWNVVVKQKKGYIEFRTREGVISLLEEVESVPPSGGRYLATLKTNRSFGPPSRDHRNGEFSRFSSTHFFSPNYPK